MKHTYFTFTLAYLTQSDFFSCDGAFNTNTDTKSNTNILLKHLTWYKPVFTVQWATICFLNYKITLKYLPAIIATLNISVRWSKEHCKNEKNINLPNEKHLKTFILWKWNMTNYSTTPLNRPPWDTGSMVRWSGLSDGQGFDGGTSNPHQKNIYINAVGDNGCSRMGVYLQCEFYTKTF